MESLVIDFGYNVSVALAASLHMVAKHLVCFEHSFYKRDMAGSTASKQSDRVSHKGNIMIRWAFFCGDFRIMQVVDTDDSIDTWIPFDPDVLWFFYNLGQRNTT